MLFYIIPTIFVSYIISVFIAYFIFTRKKVKISLDSEASYLEKYLQESYEKTMEVRKKTNGGFYDGVWFMNNKFWCNKFGKPLPDKLSINGAIYSKYEIENLLKKFDPNKQRKKIRERAKKAHIKNVLMKSLFWKIIVILNIIQLIKFSMKWCAKKQKLFIKKVIDFVSSDIEKRSFLVEGEEPKRIKRKVRGESPNFRVPPPTEEFDEEENYIFEQVELVKRHDF